MLTIRYKLMQVIYKYKKNASMSRMFLVFFSLIVFNLPHQSNLISCVLFFHLSFFCKWNRCRKQWRLFCVFMSYNYMNYYTFLTWLSIIDWRSIHVILHVAFEYFCYFYWHHWTCSIALSQIIIDLIEIVSKTHKWKKTIHLGVQPTW